MPRRELSEFQLRNVRSELQLSLRQRLVDLQLLITELLNLTHHTIQFVDEIGVIAVPAKRSHKRSVVPKSAILLSAEPLEHFKTVSSKLSQYRPRVMQFI